MIDFSTRPLILAPMAEISHSGLRNLIHELGGCDYYFTEMISANRLITGGDFEDYYLDLLPTPQNTIFQLVDGEEEKLLKAVDILKKYPAAGVDINMGCSAPAIMKLNSGFRWMSRGQETFTMLKKVRERYTQGSLSVKIRVGEKHNLPFLLDFVRSLEDTGIDFLTLHGRSRKDKFKGRARWNYIEKIKEVIDIPVIGNGDIIDQESYLYRQQFPSDGIMIGRGAVRRPWIFSRLREQETPLVKIDRFSVLTRFIELLQTSQPKDFWNSRLKRFIYYYSENFPFGHHLKTRIYNQKSFAQAYEVLQEYIEKHPEEQYTKE